MHNPHTLHIYMAWHCNDAERCACLVFARNIPEAKRVAHPVIAGWDSDTRRADIIIEPKPLATWLYPQADQQKLIAGLPHAIETPQCCARCQRWGSWIDGEGVCEGCGEEGK